jgi:opacity protein-like surface antigen
MTALLFPMIAYAEQAEEEEPDFSRPGPYVAAGFSVDFLDSSDLKDAGVDYSFDPNFGITAAVGYRLSERIGVEAGVDYGFDANLKIGGNKVGKTTAWVSTLDFKGYLLTGRVQPFGMIGLGAGYAKFKGSGLADDVRADETAFVIRFGGGIDTYISENIALFVDGSWVLTTGRLSDVDYATVGAGLMYRF